MNKKIVYKGTELSSGRYLFNKCLPDDYPVINKQITKDVLLYILNDIALNYPPEITIDTLDKIKKFGFNTSTNKGYTLGIEDLYFEDMEEYCSTMTTDFSDIKNNITTNMKKLNNEKIIKRIKDIPVYNYVESGARGSMDQFKQLCLCRGYVADANNNIVPEIIKSSFSVGLNEKESFNSCWGTRKGLLDTALSTSSSGYLTRKLIYSTVYTVLGEENDCGTKDFLEIDVSVKDDFGNINIEKSEKLAKTLLWRYILTTDNKLHLITTKNYKSIIGKKIKMRSPIYCKSPKICRTCYGNLAKSGILHSDQIGLLASQALAERSTQLVLRTFHVGGVVQKTGKDNEKNEDIIAGIGLVNKLFHNPSKIGIETPDDLCRKIYDVFSNYGSIHFVHYEVIVTSMMWYKNKIWRTLSNREKYPHEWVSILSIPSRGSWLLGAAFSRLKSKLLEGLYKNREDVPSSISNLFRY